MIRMARIDGRWRVTLGRLVIYSGRSFRGACIAARVAGGAP